MADGMPTRGAWKWQHWFLLFSFVVGFPFIVGYGLKGCRDSEKAAKYLAAAKNRRAEFLNEAEGCNDVRLKRLYTECARREGLFLDGRYDDIVAALTADAEAGRKYFSSLALRARTAGMDGRLEVLRQYESDRPALISYVPETHLVRKEVLSFVESEKTKELGNSPRLPSMNKMSFLLNSDPDLASVLRGWETWLAVSKNSVRRELEEAGVKFSDG